MVRNKWFLFIGLIVLIFLIISYFVTFISEEGQNYQTTDNLLGAVIFHNPFILGLYILVATVLIVSGLKRKDDVKKARR